MTKSQQMLYSKSRSRTIVHGNPVQQFVLRLGLAVDKYGWDADMIETLPVLGGDTGRCNENSINAPSMEGFNDFHLLVRIIVSGAEQNTEASDTGNFFDALDNITEERIVYGCHYQTDRARASRLQALCNGVGRITHLMCQVLDAFSHFDTNERTIVQGPRDRRV